MKIIKEHIDEKFTEESDPIHDLGIGIEHQIKQWLKEINYEKLKGDDVFALCAEYGKLEFVKYLLEKGANVNHIRSYALRYASNNGHTEVVKLLLDAGADVHADDDKALRWASNNGHTEVVKLLLDAGADIHAIGDYALRNTSYRGHTEVVKLLKDHIVKEKKLKKRIKESLNERFTYDENSDPIADMNIGMIHQIKKWMESEGYKYNNKDYALIICAKHGKTEFVRYLLDAGADVHANDDYALRWASNDGYTEVVKILLNAGADVHANDDEVLTNASYNGHTEVVKLLLDAGADVHVDNDKALRWTSYHGRTEVVKLLLDAGADVHADDDNALKLASYKGHTEVVKLLKDHIKKEEQKFKKSIYEKFSNEDSDPIADIGIGGYSFETLKRGAVIKSKKLGIAVTRNNSGQFTSWIYGFKLPPTCDILVINVTSYIYNKKEYKRIYFSKYYNKQDLIDSIESLKQGRLPKSGGYNTMIVSKKMFDNRFEVIERGF